MSDILTNEEKQAIRANAKPNSLLPVIYEDETNPSKPVSRTYEAHLILTETKVKREALEWIDKSIAILQETDTDRDDLFNEFKQNLLSDSDYQLSELENELQGFENFRNNFANSKLSPLELGWLFEDISTAMGKLQARRNIQDHRKALLGILKG